MGNSQQYSNSMFKTVRILHLVTELTDNTLQFAKRLYIRRIYRQPILYVRRCAASTIFILGTFAYSEATPCGISSWSAQLMREMHHSLESYTYDPLKYKKGNPYLFYLHVWENLSE